MEGSDYINASFIDVSLCDFITTQHFITMKQGYSERKSAYIAAQGKRFFNDYHYSIIFTFIVFYWLLLS